MTTEEAIKQLEYDKAMCLFNPMTGEEKPMNEDCRRSAEADELAEWLCKQMWQDYGKNQMLSAIRFHQVRNFLLMEVDNEQT